MTTLPPPAVNPTPEQSMEKKVYEIVDKFKEHLPVLSDRYRMGFTLYKFMKGEGDPPEVLVKSNKIKVQGISLEELAQKLSVEIQKLKSTS
jgi:hypothetical protein